MILDFIHIKKAYYALDVLILPNINYDSLENDNDHANLYYPPYYPLHAIPKALYPVYALHCKLKQFSDHITFSFSVFASLDHFSQ